MPAIDFPDVGVTAGQIFTAQGKTWEYNGISWDLVDSQEFIGTASVVAEKLATGAVTTAKLAPGAVTSAKMAADSVGTTSIANDAVTSDKIAANAVGSSEIADNAVSAGKIASLAVTEAKINDLAVTTAKINDLAVVEAKVADGAVTTAKLANASVDGTKLAADAVTLGSQTTGNYVGTITAGTGVSTTGATTGEGIAHTISIGQAVATTSEVTFAGLKVAAVIEPLTVAATAATGTIPIDAVNGTTYYTTNASANWIVNLRWNSATTLDSKLAVGEMVTTSFMVRQGATPYYPTSIQVNGTTSGVTTRWQGSTGAPTAGNANSTDMYTFTVVKTSGATFDVFAAQTRFA